ncbi:MAG: thiamine pyrophosphate-binding protein [Desulfobacterales bacterium]|nr:thiamine pyrophosphate-binding protein [Desulfobacterales bacterium]
MTDVLTINDMERPKDAGKFPMSFASDAIAEMLRRLNIEFVALNPGASFRYLHDSIVNYLGNKNPQMVLCLHEEHAVAIAHGYARVTGKPMGVILHSNVGLMHATMTIFNAWCDRVPVIILGGTGPVDAALRRPWIDWIHTAKDQGALVRDYTKWDDQPASVTAALESLLRASLIAQTPPKGPVYICRDVALQEAELEENVPIPDVNRFSPALPQEAPRESIRKAADLLMNARRPLILAGRVSRNQSDWDCRVRLAESLGAKVITDIKVGAAFPTSHPLHAAGPGIFLSSEAVSLIREADVLLSLDWVDLAGSLKEAWGKEQAKSKIIHCSVDSYIHNGWSMDYQGLPSVDIPILAEPDIVTASLLKLIEELPGRGAAFEKGTQGQKENPPGNNPSDSGAGAASGKLRLSDIALCLKKATGNKDVCLIRVPILWPAHACDFKTPLDYLGGDAGGCVGAGPGLAVGGALALRGTCRLPVAILGDGDYLMGVTALWTAAHYHIPLLIVVANNRCYNNSEGHQLKVARLRRRPVENKWIGQRIDDPLVDIAGMARAQGLEAEGPITDPAALAGALSRAVKAVKKGSTYVLDVLVENE